ncbi:MAG: EAL domain-containing protein [Gammaproteobacteria bacterium]
MKSILSSATGSAEEISALIEVLHRTGQRLEELTAGEVDAVADVSGQTFLLRGAQETARFRDASRQAAVLNALPALIALVDTQGVIVSVNEAWRDFSAWRVFEGAGHAIGANYLSICDGAQGEGSDFARRAGQGIRSVLSGAQRIFSVEYSCPTATTRRWFLLRVTPLPGECPNGAVIMHLDITAERETQENLRISDARFRQMAENILDVFFLRSFDSSHVYYVSPAYRRIWGRTCESLYENPASWAESIHPEDRQAVATVFRDDGKIGFDCEYRMIRPNGEIRWIHVRGFPILDATGHPYRTAGIATDITARKESDDKLRRLNRVHAVLSGINSLIVRVLDRDALLNEVCRIAVKAGAFKMAWIGAIVPETLDGKVVASFGGERGYVNDVRLTAREGKAQSAEPACRALRQSRPVICNDIGSDASVAARRDELLSRGHRSVGFFPLTVAGRPAAVLALWAGEADVFDAEETQLLLELAGNISFALDHLEKSEKLNYVAFYDVLTGLANRRLFLERVTQYMRGASRGQGKLAVCVIDLVRFKDINDTFGQPEGDSLLKQVAQWLTRNLGDVNLLARVGTDRFAVVLPEVENEESVARLLEGAMKVFLEQDFTLKESPCRVAAKVGVALFPDDGTDADSLFRNAESALKKAKASTERYLFYAQKMTETVAGRLVLEYQLRHALEKDEFVLHYQPKLDLLSGRITGAEALIRWNDPRTGLVPPGRFIPILEETGLILEVGRWALRQAVAEHLRWRNAGLDAVRIAVNVSPMQLRHRDFLAEIEAAIGVDANAAAGLELEITESLIMEDMKRTIGTLQAIREMGVTIAIDDFGTGFSSLSYLARLPTDTLKIDRSFVTDMIGGHNGILLVSAIVNLAHSLKLNVVAEGVETEDQAELLRVLTCDEMQGFLFSKALPGEVFETRFLQGVGPR